ncbi:MAG: hypothetical protein ACP5UU_01910 [Thermoprotei archaeon]
MPEKKEYVVSLKLAKLKHGKKRAPHAIKMLQKALMRRLKDGELKIDPELNSFVWSKGIRKFPRILEVVAEREKSDEPWLVRLKSQEGEAPGVEEAKEKQGASGEPVAQNS